MNQQSIHVNTAAARAQAEAISHRREEFGRRAILWGCIIAMIGMVTYIYCTTQGGPDATIYSTLFDTQVAGWGAFLCLVTGVGMWVTGNIALLNEAERREHEQ